MLMLAVPVRASSLVRCRPSFTTSATIAERLLHSSPSRLQRQLTDLPEKVSVRTGPLGRLAKVIEPRQSNSITTRVGSSFGGNHSLQWCSAPKNVLLAKKQRDGVVSDALSQVIQHVNKLYPDMNIIVEPETYEQLSGQFPDLVSCATAKKDVLARKVDLAITLGGDGTILHVSSLFDQSAVPPVLSFSMDINSFEAAFRDVIHSKVSLLLRMRLHQTIHETDGSLVESNDRLTNDVHLMNEVALHRGRSPHMTTIDAYVDGRHLTKAISDGLIIATPTGSTAYSLSAGGPIVHPSVQSLLLTPICPRSLSFRPVLLPSDANIQLKVSKQSRASADIIVDGREMQSLQPGQYLQVAMSPYPIPCVNRTSTNVNLSRFASGDANDEQDSQSLLETATSQAQVAKSERGEDDWVRDINTLLRFNASFSGRGLLSGKGGYEESDDK